MSDLEFERELSPQQIREALSLLDSRAGAQNQNVRVEDLIPLKCFIPNLSHPVRPLPSRTALLLQKTRTNVRSI